MLKGLRLRAEAPFPTRLLARAASVAAAGTLTCPLEVALVRMQGDLHLPPAQQRVYRGVHDALRRIGSQEGLAVLWSGVLATTLRATLQSLSATAALELGRIELPVGAGFDALNRLLPTLCRILGVLLWLPVDAVKSRIQHQLGATGSGRSAARRGVPSSILRTVHEIIVLDDGLRALLRGFAAAAASAVALEWMRVLVDRAADGIGPVAK
jgi:solute carrier family 25 oxoglutarate transporter 11